MKFLNARTLNTVAGVPISALAMPAATPVLSEIIKIDGDVGFGSVLLNESHGGASGNCDVTAKYSFDGTNFYEFYTTSAGALTKDANWVSALSNAIRMIMVTLRPAPYLQITFTPNADSILTASFGYQEEL